MRVNNCREMNEIYLDVFNLDSDDLNTVNYLVEKHLSMCMKLIENTSDMNKSINDVALTTFNILNDRQYNPNVQNIFNFGFDEGENPYESFMPLNYVSAAVFLALIHADGLLEQIFDAYEDQSVNRSSNVLLGLNVYEYIRAGIVFNENYRKKIYTMN